MNLSLGTPANNPIKSDPLVRAVNAAVNSGITVVVAAGNSGPNSKTILSPGNSKSAITVGAVDDRKTKANNDYTIAPFSSRGPTKEGVRKPDVVAPGVKIKSLSNVDGYQTLSGTSMATPVVTGSLALLLSKNGRLGPKELKSRLMDSSTSLDEDKDHQGSGVVNVGKLFGDENPKPSKPSRPSPSKPQRRPRRKPIDKPIIVPKTHSETYIIEKQSYVSEGLIFLMFLILLLIRVI